MYTQGRAYALIHMHPNVQVFKPQAQSKPRKNRFVSDKIGLQLKSYCTLWA